MQKTCQLLDREYMGVSFLTLHLERAADNELNHYIENKFHLQVQKYLWLLVCFVNQNSEDKCSKVPVSCVCLQSNCHKWAKTLMSSSFYLQLQCFPRELTDSKKITAKYRGQGKKKWQNKNTLTKQNHQHFPLPEFPEFIFQFKACRLAKTCSDYITLLNVSSDTIAWHHAPLSLQVFQTTNFWITASGRTTEMKPPCLPGRAGAYVNKSHVLVLLLNRCTWTRDTNYLKIHRRNVQTLLPLVPLSL